MVTPDFGSGGSDDWHSRAKKYNALFTKSQQHRDWSSATSRSATDRKSMINHGNASDEMPYTGPDNNSIPEWGYGADESMRKFTEPEGCIIGKIEFKEALM
tara:strand:- start:841 stop:1143 length:303 start_codon:yes stop_codon:yes gene_type:complete